MDKRRLEHYRTYMKIYGSMMVDLTYSDEYLQKLIAGNDLSPLERALRHQIEHAPKCE